MNTLATESLTSPLVIVCGADDRYAMPLAVTLYSTLINLEKDSTLYLYIIDGGISTKSQKQLQKVLNIKHIDLHIKWITPPEQKFLNGVKTHSWVSTATYLRLLIPDVLPEKFEKAIYLDSDLLVMANLRELWNEEIENYALLAVRDTLVQNISSHLGIIKYKELGLEPETPYFNAGVLVINLKKWRSEKIRQKVLEYLCKYKKYIQMGDQEGINAVLANDWKHLHYKWNVMPHILAYERWEESTVKDAIRPIVKELIHNPNICHFAGFHKPWQLVCEHPLQLQWIRYLKQSGWFEPKESILWFTNSFVLFYLQKIKILIRLIIFKIGFEKLWKKLRDSAHQNMTLRKILTGDLLGRESQKY
jgi:lipopolysaccharide biosynthesis glycosyltransferase